LAAPLLTPMIARGAIVMRKIVMRKIVMREAAIDQVALLNDTVPPIGDHRGGDAAS
jgi:hypothetical protein